MKAEDSVGFVSGRGFKPRRNGAMKEQRL